MTDTYCVNATPEELESAAAAEYGALQMPDDPRGQPAHTYSWRYVDEFPIALIDEASFNWRGWFEDEVRMWADEGQPHRYDELVEGPILEAVVLVEYAGRAWLWDGCHRTAASVVAGRDYVPAIVGTPKGHAYDTQQSNQGSGQRP